MQTFQGRFALGTKYQNQQAAIGGHYAGITAHQRIGAFEAVEHISVQVKLAQTRLLHRLQLTVIAFAIAVHVTPEFELAPFVIAGIEDAILIAVELGMLQGLQVAHAGVLWIDMAAEGDLVEAVDLAAVRVVFRDLSDEEIEKLAALRPVI